MKIDFTKSEKQLKLKNDVEWFCSLMLEKMMKKWDEKTDSYKRCSNEYLEWQLHEHFVKRQWVDCANFCFMLWDNQQKKLTV